MGGWGPMWPWACGIVGCSAVGCHLVQLWYCRAVWPWGSEAVGLWCCGVVLYYYACVLCPPLESSTFRPPAAVCFVDPGHALSWCTVELYGNVTFQITC